MPKGRIAFVFALSCLGLAACGGREPATAENDSVNAESGAPGKASPSDVGQANASIEPGADSVRPPDAVSHPDGYLPNASDLPAPPAPEPAAGGAPGSREPATEDEYIRNRQAGG